MSIKSKTAIQIKINIYRKNIYIYGLSIVFENKYKYIPKTFLICNEIIGDEAK